MFYNCMFGTDLPLHRKSTSIDLAAQVNFGQTCLLPAGVAAAEFREWSLHAEGVQRFNARLLRQAFGRQL